MNNKVILKIGIACILIGLIMMLIAGSLFCTQEKPNDIIDTIGSICFWSFPVPLMIGLSLIIFSIADNNRKT